MESLQITGGFPRAWLGHPDPALRLETTTTFVHRLLPFHLCLVLSALFTALADADEPNRWEQTIQAFEARDRQYPPAQDGVLFVGSSSIRLWKLDEHFPKLSALNRGFGGSQMSDVLHFMDRIVLPYQPRAIVLYEGDNDIASGKPAEQIHKDFKSFVQRVRSELPNTRIVFIAIKPSIARWKLIEPMREANQLIKAETKGDPRLVYLDIEPHMLGTDGKPKKELFVKDGLHLNRQGYELWSRLLRPHLANRLP